MSIKAKKTVKSILQRYKLKVPVDLSFIAQQEGIQIRQESLEDRVSGMLILKEEQSIIVINQEHHPNRQRFTIAHELGHFFLHKNLAHVFFDESLLFFRDEHSAQGSKYHEIEANIFAAELLMPEQFLLERLLDESFDALDDLQDSALGKLAAELEVSSQALTIRLTRLGLITV
jgi:Zn-dependent peptidase ImmA (M78 family)